MSDEERVLALLDRAEKWWKDHPPPPPSEKAVALARKYVKLPAPKRRRS